MKTVTFNGSGSAQKEERVRKQQATKTKLKCQNMLERAAGDAAFWEI